MNLLWNGNGQNDLAIGFPMLGNCRDPTVPDPLQAQTYPFEKCANICPGGMKLRCLQQFFDVLFCSGNAHVLPTDHFDGLQFLPLRGQLQKRPGMALRQIPFF